MSIGGSYIFLFRVRNPTYTKITWKVHNPMHFRNERQFVRDQAKNTYGLYKFHVKH